MSRRLIDLTEGDLEALIERRLTAFAEEVRAEAPSALLDRQGLARALSCSTKTLDRLRAEPNFPETSLFDSPRFELALVLAWMRARKACDGLRAITGGKR